MRPQLAHLAVAVLIVFASGASQPQASDDILQRSKAAYAALTSYADTGAVVNEFGTSSTERSTFTTLFRRSPRAFNFDFKAALGDRFVIWADPNAFHTWWKSIGSKEDYPNPNNIGAFTYSPQHTVGVSSKVALLLFGKAAAQGDFAYYTAAADGSESVAGHDCYRIKGMAHDEYGATGRQVNERQMIVWIDRDSLLIRKIVEEWKPLPGQRSRRTVTFEPMANPSLDDSRFRFTPPAP